MKLLNAHLEILISTSLFAGMKRKSLMPLLISLNARVSCFEKGEALLWEGNTVSDIGIFLTGRGRAVKEEASGKQLIITLLKPGSVFGDVLSASDRHKSPVTVLADDTTEVLLFSAAEIMESGENSSPERNILLRNYVRVISEKYLALHERIDCLIKPTVREKILALLLLFLRDSVCGEIIVPFDREGMAKYLNVERSALSRELSRMRRDGLVDYSKNSFFLSEGARGE